MAAWGLVALIGMRGTILSWPPRHWDRELRWLSPRPSWRIFRAFAGATAAVYTDLTVVVYSYHYRPVEAALFGLLALLCAGLAVILSFARGPGAVLVSAVVSSREHPGRNSFTAWTRERSPASPGTP